MNETVALANGETRTLDDIKFAETHVTRHYDEEVVLIDIGGGVQGVTAGLNDACDPLEVDLVGADAGGDVLAAGNEPGIKSPLTDAVMLSIQPS